jgi:CRP-like cAMP-binding protein
MRANSIAFDSMKLASAGIRDGPSTNRLLETLPRLQSRRVLDQCEAVVLKFGEILYQPDARIRHVYFPTDGFISLTLATDGAGDLEIALIGSEGMVGAPLVLGVDVSALRATVQGDGFAWRMSSATLIRALSRNPALRRGLHLYLQVQMSQLARIATCVRFHLVEQRLARCLLMSQDRANSDEFHATQEGLADRLGVRRVGVTKAASALQSRRLIGYHRGSISILDRSGMLAAVCGCYQADRQVYEELFRAPA